MYLLGTKDVGPASYLACLSKRLHKAVYCSELPAFDLFGKRGVKLCDKWMGMGHAKLVVTGTCLENGLDKDMLQWANKKNIPCVSVIEHWSWYRKRFETSEGLLLPDWIFINDEIAREDAILDGLPAEKLIVAGNPVLEELASSSAGKGHDRETLRLHYALPEKRLIVFVSEELASEFKFGTPDYLGYDEHMAIQAVQSLLAPDDHLIVKLHPAEQPGKYAYLGDTVTRLGWVSVFDLANLADVVIGMDSMLLLELATLRSDIISFRPNARKRFIGERLGVTVCAGDKDTLQGLLSSPDLARVADGFHERFKGSGKRIAGILEELANK